MPVLDKNQHSISIIVPIYNKNIYLRECLNSIRVQSYKNFEVILVDNLFTETSSDICEDFVKEDNRFKYFKVADAGISKLKNYGLIYSCGEFITFISPDDWIESNYLNNLLDNIVKNEADISISSYKIFDTDSKYYLRTYSKQDFRFLSFGILNNKEFLEIFPRLIELDQSFYISSSKLFRKELIEGAYFNENLEFNEDLDFYFRLYYKAKKITFEKIATYIFRNYDGKYTEIDSNRKLHEELSLYTNMCNAILKKEYANVYYIEKYKQLINNETIKNSIEFNEYKKFLDNLESNISYPNKLISIIIPIYNVEEYLRDCLDSVSRQTYPYFEAILVNDGSPDNSEKICLEYAQRDARFKYIKKENGGLSDARNKGLSISKGEYVTFIDSDDYVEDSYLEDLYSAALRNNSDLVLSRYKEYKNGDIIFYVHQIKEKEIQYSGEELIKNLSYLETQNLLFITSWGNLYHKRLFDHVSFPKGRVLEDLGTSYKLFMEVEHATYLVKELYIYRVRNGSITSHQNEKLYTDLLDILLEKISIYSLKGIDIEQEKGKLIQQLESYSNQMFNNGMENSEIYRRYKEMLFLLGR